MNSRSQTVVAKIHTVHEDDPKIDLNIMTAGREILEQYRAELKQRIEDLFIWALGNSVITEITQTVRDTNSTSRKELRIRKRDPCRTNHLKIYIPDRKIKKKIRKSDMTIETIPDLIHEYMYNRLNESNNSNDGKEIQHIGLDKSSYERTKNTKITDVVHLTGQEYITARQSPQNAVIAKEGDITRRCTDH